LLGAGQLCLARSSPSANRTRPQQEEISFLRPAGSRRQSSDPITVIGKKQEISQVIMPVLMMKKCDKKYYKSFCTSGFGPKWHYCYNRTSVSKLKIQSLSLFILHL
jgi:hypothetical protein